MPANKMYDVYTITMKRSKSQMESIDATTMMTITGVHR